MVGGTHEGGQAKDPGMHTTSSGEHQDIDLMEVMEGKVADNVMLYDGDTVRVFEVSGPDWYRVLPVAASTASLLSSILIILLQISNRVSTK